jgi:metal-responsive CopG/Arc/MetJ family transcriptional regulator
MDEGTEKIRVGFYIDKNLLDKCDQNLKTANARSRNEFVGDALKFYLGYLTSQKGEDYLLKSLASVLNGSIEDSENRIARITFKMAVELSKLAHVIAYSHDVDEQTMQKLHVKCLDEVRRINGAVKFEDAYKYQKREI